MELEFCTRFTISGSHVIYAGAGPGHHIIPLSRKFPEVYFHLYDPNPIRIPESDQIKVHPYFFTYSTAQYWSEQSVTKLFISDKPTSGLQSEDETENYVKEDMDAQMNWVRIISPMVSLLKFCLCCTPSDISKGRFIFSLEQVLLLLNLGS